MEFIFDIALKLSSFPCIIYFIASLALMALELFEHKLARGGF